MIDVVLKCVLEGYRDGEERWELVSVRVCVCEKARERGCRPWHDLVHHAAVRLKGSNNLSSNREIKKISYITVSFY